MPVAEELTPGAGPQPRLYALSVAVRWGRNRALELASLRAVAEPYGAREAHDRPAPLTLPFPRAEREARVHADRGASGARASWPRRWSSCSAGSASDWPRGSGARSATAKLDHTRSLARAARARARRRLPLPDRPRGRAGGADPVRRPAGPSHLRHARASVPERRAGRVHRGQPVRRRRRGWRCASRSCPTRSRWTVSDPSWWIRGRARLRFRYLGREPEAWQDTWDVRTEEGLPRAVEITLVTRAGPRGVPQMLTVPMRAAAP